MQKFKALPILAGAAIAAFGLALGSHHVAAGVISGDITSCHITTGCPSGGSVSVTDITGGVDVKVTLAPNEVFAQTGAGGGETALFNLSGNPIVGVTTVTANLINPTSTDTFGIDRNTSGIMADGAGDFTYGVHCTLCGNGTSPPILVSPIEFDLTGSVTTASFVRNASGNFFAFDVGICSGTGVCGSASNPITSTGVVDVSAVPAPLLGHGLFVLLAVGGVLGGGKLLENLKKQHRLQAA